MPEETSTPTPTPAFAPGKVYQVDWLFHEDQPLYNQLPQWFKDATTSKAQISFDEKNQLIWHNGIWHNGYWRGYEWRNGTWLNGTWIDGLWCYGTWLRGEFLEGTWAGGTWIDGTFGRKAIWKSGAFKGGTFYGTFEHGQVTGGIFSDGAIFKRGYFHCGYFSAGAKWEGGIWHGGIFATRGKDETKHGPLPGGTEASAAIVIPWTVTHYTNSAGVQWVTIGCKTRSIAGWDKFFAPDCPETLNTPRNNVEFKRIRASYMAYRAWIEHMYGINTTTTKQE